MENSGYIGLSRQMTLRRELGVIANNLANMNTAAYKAESMLFVEHLKKANDGQQLSFVQDIALYRNFSEGEKTNTGNDLDLAISGDGYFEVETDLGPRFTRNGAFRLNPDGEIVTGKGHKVMDDLGRAVVVPPDSGNVSIAPDGTVSAANGPVGRIKLVRFDNPQEMTKLSGSLYDANDQEPQRAEDAEVLQGMIEQSNVQGIVEMTRMIAASRSYVSASQLVNEEHKLQRQAIQILGTKAT